MIEIKVFLSAGLLLWMMLKLTIVVWYQAFEMTAFFYRLSVTAIALSISGVGPVMTALAQQAPAQAELPPGITIDFNLVRACLLPPGQATALALAGVVGNNTAEDRRLVRVNVKCEHRLLMAQGMGLQRLTQHFVKLKKEKADDKVQSTSRLDLL